MIIDSVIKYSDIDKKRGDVKTLLSYLDIVNRLLSKAISIIGIEACKMSLRNLVSDYEMLKKFEINDHGILVQTDRIKLFDEETEQVCVAYIIGAFNAYISDILEAVGSMSSAQLGVAVIISAASESAKEKIEIIEIAKVELENKINERTKELDDALRRQTALNQLLYICLEDIPIKEILNRFLKILFSIPWVSLVSKGAIFLSDNERKVLILEAQLNLSEPLTTLCAQVPFGTCICGKAALSMEIQFVNTVGELHKKMDGMVPHGHYCVPVIYGEVLLGVLNLYVEDGHIDSEKEKEFLSTAANVLATTIMHKDAEAKLKEVNASLARSERALKNTMIDMQKTHDDLKSTQVQLVQSEKLASIGQLAAGVAHEINNPIGFVSSNVQALDGYVESFMKFFRIVDNLKKSIESEDIKKSKSLIEEVRILEKEDNFDFIIKDISNLVDQSNLGLERVKKIVMDLRTFARESSDEKMELVSVNDVIESALSIVNNEIKYKCELEKDFGELPAIKCHPQKISQVVMNLVMNASQAIQDKGKIRIKTYLKDKYECIDIEDTGSGIPQEKINKIFDPFFTTKDVGKGTGLGLSISYDIVKLHGGDILVESQVGRGTKMTIVLPLIQKGSENSKQPSEPSS